jgi:ribonuclease HII
MVIIGIDEVGRGCWAGPLVAGAVIMNTSIYGLTDSKALSRKQRENFNSEILVHAEAIGLGWVKSIEVDDLGLTEAVRLAMTRALNEINIAYDQIIIDGNINYFQDNPKSRAIIKADATVGQVSAASIVAKVARDNFMYQAALNYPGYGFEKHVGYGTKLHQNALLNLGLTELHRKSFKPVADILKRTNQSN